MISIQKKNKVQCSYCSSENYRRSKWVSHAERNSHAGSLPFRCLDCTKRFFGDQQAAQSNRRPLIVFTLIALVLFVVGAVFMFSTSGHDSKNRHEADVPELKKASKSISAFLKSAEAGDPKAQFEVGQILLKESAGNAKKIGIAVRWLKSAASSGNVDAMLVLGRLSKAGMGVLQSFEDALKWIQMAANLGSPEGMLELGRLYRDGIALERDPVQAYIWMNRAAALQNLTAANERDRVARALPADKLKEAQSLSLMEAKTNAN
jgi:DNA-directed RNA polymerase subunit RPC12/RpoP